MKIFIEILVKCFVKILFNQKSRWLLKKGKNMVKSRPVLCLAVVGLTIFGMKLSGCSSVNEAFLAVVDEHVRTLSENYSNLVREEDNPEFVVYDKITRIYRKVEVEEPDDREPSKIVKKIKFRPIEEDDLFYFKIRDENNLSNSKFRRLEFYNRVELFTPDEKMRHIKTRLETVSELNRVIKENRGEPNASKN